jgi:hypothetical protein
MERLEKAGHVSNIVNAVFGLVCVIVGTLTFWLTWIQYRRQAAEPERATPPAPTWNGGTMSSHLMIAVLVVCVILVVIGIVNLAREAIRIRAGHRHLAQLREAEKPKPLVAMEIVEERAPTSAELELNLRKLAGELAGFLTENCYEVEPEPAGPMGDIKELMLDALSSTPDLTVKNGFDSKFRSRVLHIKPELARENVLNEAVWYKGIPRYSIDKAIGLDVDDAEDIRNIVNGLMRAAELLRSRYGLPAPNTPLLNRRQEEKSRVMPENRPRSFRLE